MTNRAKKFFAISLLTVAGYVSAAVEQSNNLFLARAFSSNTARDLMMSSNAHHAAKDNDGWMGSFSVAGAYQRNWNQEDGKGLGAHWAWSGTNSMSVQSNASGTAASTDVNVEASQLGLGMAVAKKSMKLEPVLYQAGANLQLHVACSANEPGFYGRVSAPVGVMSIDPKLTSDVKKGTDYVQGLYNKAAAAVAVPYANMVEAMAGGKNMGTFGTGLKNGIIKGKQTTGARFGDLNFSLGYNVVCDDEKCFSVGLRASAGTGNKAEGVYALEPVFGNGGGFGFGGEVAGHVCLWEGHSDNSLSLHLDANVMHLFKKKSQRVYDLKDNGAGSKYLLVADYKDNAFAGNQTAIQNLANVSNLESESSFAAMGDASVMLEYVTGGWNLGLGYNFWGRSAETLTITGTLDKERWAVLGLQAPYSAADGTTDAFLCQKNAKMNSMTGRVNSAAGDAVDATDKANRIAGNAALDLDGAKQQAACTSKVFGSVGYSWNESEYCPFIKAMGEFELSHSDNNALAQWGVGLAGGVSF